MTDDLISWLRVQIDDDERVAREATGDPWRPHERYPRGVYAMFKGRIPALIAEACACAPDVSMEQVKAHIIRWDPARVLAEVDAKWRIIDHLDPVPRGASPSIYVLRLLALPYADRPGYREEWKP